MDGQDHDHQADRAWNRIDLGFGGLTVSPSDHIAHFYRTNEEWKEVAIPYLLKGLESNDKCVCVANSEPEHRAVLEALDKAGIDLKAVLASGQLELCEGASEPEEMKEWIGQVLSDIPVRYPLLRLVGIMGWTFKKMPDSDTLMVWESACNLMGSPPAIFLCQYDLNSFMGSVVLDAMRTHPICIIGSAIHKNAYYQEPKDFLSELNSRQQVC